MQEIIYIGFSRPRKWYKLGSKLIQWAEGTPYSHTYVRWFSRKYGTGLLYEAVNSGINFKSVPQFLEDNKCVHEFALDITPEQKYALIKFCIQNAGRKYGWMQLFGILAVRIFKLKHNPFTGGNICSELVGKILEGPLEVKTGLNLDIAGVKDIYQFLESRRSNK